MTRPFTVIRRTLALLGPERRWRWIVLVVLAVLMAGLEAAGALLIFLLMSLVGDPSGSIDFPVVGNVASLFPEIGRETLLLGVAIAVGAFFVLRGFALVSQAYIQARLTHNAAANLASHLVRGYLAMPYQFHTQRNSAELVRNTFDSVRSLTSEVMLPLAKLISQSVIVVALLVVLLWTSPLATLLAVAAFVPVIGVLLWVVQPRLKRIGRRAQSAAEGSLKAVQQALAGVRDIKLLGREDFFARAFKDERRRLARTYYVHQALGELPRALIETVLVLIVVALFSTAIVGGESLDSLLSTLGVFAYAGLRVQPSLRDIVKAMNNIKFGSALLDDLSEDRRRVDAALAAEQEQYKTAETPMVEFQSELRLKNIIFRYHADSAPALDVSKLVIRKGEFVGVCGPTGGGKSTLVDLIAGLLQPTSGTVLIDGVGLSGREQDWWAQLGVVSQNVFLTDDTVRRNIALGRTHDDIDEPRLERAVRRAQLVDVIESLPNGLDTPVGERGIRLSGGQRQRIAIARAFYREPSVLILDEGTSALDSATEAALVDAIDELKEGRTLIAVAHRLSTVRNADRILVVESGRISADGPYDRLLEENELFRSLAR